MLLFNAWRSQHAAWLGTCASLSLTAQQVPERRAILAVCRQWAAQRQGCAIRAEQALWKGQPSRNRASRCETASDPTQWSRCGATCPARQRQRQCVTRLFSCNSQLRRRTVTGLPLCTLSRSWRTCSGSVPGPCRKRLRGVGGQGAALQGETRREWRDPAETGPCVLRRALPVLSGCCRRLVACTALGPAPGGQAAATRRQGGPTQGALLLRRSGSRGVAPVVPDGLLSAVACHPEEAF